MPLIFRTLQNRVAPDVPPLLNQPKVTLKGRLQNFFKAIQNVHN
ncbi:MAG: hypothetical protein ACYTX0_54755 [Nostoc sp.]